MKTFQTIRESISTAAMSVAVGSTVDGVTDHEGHDGDSITNHQNNTGKDAKEVLNNTMKIIDNHRDIHHPNLRSGKAVKEEKQIGWTCSNDKHCGGNIFDRVYSDELKAPVKKCRNCGTEHPFKKRVTQKSVRRAAAHERLTSYMAKYNLDESMAVFKHHTNNVLPPVKSVKDREPLIDKIRRLVKKKRLGIKEDFRRAADHEHSMAKRYLDQMDDGEHLAIKSVGVHDKKGHIHIHYAAKGQAGGGRYVVLNRNGKEMDLKKKKK